MKKTLLYLTFSFILLFLAGCESETKQAKVVEKSPNKQERIEPLVLNTLDGKTIKMNLDNNILVSEDLNNKGKIVLVNFWATWCPPCIKEIPMFNEMYEKYGDRLEIVGILYERDKDINEINAFIKEHKMKFPVTIGENNFIAAQMFGNVQKIPESFLFSEDGFMLRKFVGIVDEAVLEEFIKTKESK